MWWIHRAAAGTEHHLHHKTGWRGESEFYCSARDGVTCLQHMNSFACRKTNFNFISSHAPRVPRAAASLWELAPHAFSLDVICHPHKTPDQYSPVTRSSGTRHPIKPWEQRVKHKRPLKTFNNHLRKLIWPLHLILRISIDSKKGLWLLFNMSGYSALTLSIMRPGVCTLIR